MRKKLGQEKLVTRLNRLTLDRINIVLLTNPENRKFAKQVLALFELSDMSSYLEDIEKYIRVELAKKIATLIRSEEISDPSMIGTALRLEGKYEAELTKVFSELSEYELAPGEAELIDKLISSELKYGILKSNARKMIDQLVELDTETFSDFHETLLDVESELGKIYQDLRKVGESINQNMYQLKFDSESLRIASKEYLDEKTAIDYRIRTGVQDFNTMLNGGFEKGKLYCFFAPKKSFKSGLMVNCCIWAKKHNSYDVSDGKRPVILYISLEDDPFQMLDRIWSYYNGNDSDVSKYSIDDYIKKMKETGIFSDNELEPRIDIIYRKNMSISTDDITTFIEDYEDVGERVVFIALDYIGRIRSVDPGVMSKGTDHVILDHVSNELIDIAKETKIPIITAAQFNRLGMEHIDKADGTILGKMKAATKATSSNVQGSFKLLQNVDFGFAMNLIEDVEQLSEKDYFDGVFPNRDFYLFLKMTECRGGAPKLTQFFTPFNENNSMRIKEDIGQKKKVSFQRRDAEEMVLNNQQNNLPPVSGMKANSAPMIIR